MRQCDSSPVRNLAARERESPSGCLLSHDLLALPLLISWPLCPHLFFFPPLLIGLSACIVPQGSAPYSRPTSVENQQIRQPSRARPGIPCHHQRSSILTGRTTLASSNATDETKHQRWTIAVEASSPSKACTRGSPCPTGGSLDQLAYIFFAIIIR
ncbi:hypothetical protein F5Y12DRAFT_745741 [Xylaria sp. FL1777]|nr:hypothetical protein F5Y12DRAFT_745741 [Xylaria sp. FL1777]